MKSLRKIEIDKFDIIENIESIIDPTQIIELKIKEIRDSKNLVMFTNLRSLEIYNHGELNLN